MRPPRGGGGFRGGRDGGRFGGGGRGGGGRFGGGGRGGGRFGGGGFRDEGPPSEVVEVSTFLHGCEGDAVTKLTNEKIPFFNAPIYLQNMTQIGKVDEIFGPINESYFSIKMMEGIVATSYNAGDKFYIDPSKLLPLSRFLTPPKWRLWNFEIEVLLLIVCMNNANLVYSSTAGIGSRLVIGECQWVEEVVVVGVEAVAEVVSEVVELVSVEEVLLEAAEVDFLEVAVAAAALGAEEGFRKALCCTNAIFLLCLHLKMLLVHNSMKF
ncbi:hypothetical protein EZV62_007593 [Acer yangbiense]|uniref:H/ACA ribonucleoprotein complex subunit n=1 Tax=Acer yangbiense TaxID=1000413 RepID=A0A5C7IB01_9ROSI|nr:hypothetical protein EZV62_007593 [Acer yangbiense]